MDARTHSLLDRYDHYRRLSHQLHEAIQRPLTRGIIREAAQRVGILVENQVVLESKEEIDIFTDFLLLGYQRGRRTMAERTLKKNWPPPGSDERLVLAAMADARYSLFRVEEAVRNVGVRVRDLIADEEIFVIDRMFGATAPRGKLMAGRLLRLPELWMTSGALVPLPPDAESQVLEMAAAARSQPGVGRLARADELAFGEAMTFACLRAGFADRVIYMER
jgi:hypothetical protein